MLTSEVEIRGEIAGEATAATHRDCCHDLNVLVPEMAYYAWEAVALIKQ